jgi:hypothetical protein
MTTTIAPQPEHASRSTAFSSVWEMASNRLLGELHENHQMSKAGYSQHPVMRYEQETTHTDQAPTTPRPYRTASRMRCRRRQSPTSSTISSVRSIQVRMGRGKVKTTSHLRPVDTPNQIRARNERLIPPLRLLPSPSPPSAANVSATSAAPVIGIGFIPATTGSMKYGPS